MRTRVQIPPPRPVFSPSPQKPLVNPGELARPLETEQASARAVLNGVPSPRPAPYLSRYSLHSWYSKKVNQRARLTSKGQITIPAAVRRALDLREGDQVVFELGQEPDNKVARLRRASDIFAMAGAVPPRKALPRTWAEERRLAREEAARRRR